jgi:subtilisin
MLNINGIVTIDKVDDDYIDWGVEAIKAPQFWRLTEGEGVTIVTMDTGVDTSHPDLQGKIKSQFNMINKNLDVTDEYGHGSHVAGLLVGEITGVAPQAELHAIKVLDGDGRGSYANIMDGITHAINLKADVLSISLGVPHDIPLILRQRIIQAYESGVTIISATGNNGRAEAFYPARMNEVIAVGGLDQNLQLTTFTNMGYDVLAPAVDILSTYKDNNYAKMTGTSMASPLVAGAIALLISHYRKQGKELKPWDIKKMLQGKVLDLTELIG